MKTITLTKTYKINLPKELQNCSKEELLNMLNRMYDINGSGMIKHSLNAEEDYSYTVLSEIDDEAVYLESNEVSNKGSYIILDGQPLNKLKES